MSEHCICTECGAFSYDATLCPACLDGDAAHEGCDDECGVHAEAGELAAEIARLTALLAVAEKVITEARALEHAAFAALPIDPPCDHPTWNDTCPTCNSSTCSTCAEEYAANATEMERAGSRVATVLREWDALKGSKGGGA